MFFKASAVLIFLSAWIPFSQLHASFDVTDAREQYQKGLAVLLKADFKKADYETVLLYFEKAKAQTAHHKEAEDVHHLSALALARVYYEMAYGLDKTDSNRLILMNRAILEYEGIPRFSRRWPEALFEQAWAYVAIEDYDGAMGALYSLKHPYFSYTFFPEVNILQAIIYGYNCRWEEAENSLQDFKYSYASLLPTLKQIMKKDLDENSWYKLLKEPGELPQNLRNYLLHEKQLGQLESSLQYITQEQQRSQSSLEVIGYLKQSEKALQKKVGLWVKDHLQQIIAEIENTQLRAQLISLEMKTAHVKWLEQESASLMVNKQTTHRPYAINERNVFWRSSAKERWIDELGYYRYAVVSRCHE